MQTVPLVLILVPHFCAIPENLDPGCDARTMEFAAAIEKAIRKRVRWRTEIVRTELPRSVCDLNRPHACIKESAIWKRLFSRSLQQPVCVVEVHSFASEHDFAVPNQGVVLWMGKPGPTAFEAKIAMETGSALLQGSNINAIGYAYERFRSGRHVLLEIRQDVNRKFLQKIASGAASAVVQTFQTPWKFE